MPNRYHFDDKIHVHYLDDKALCGTSTVVGVLGKPLTWWASGKAVELLGWTNKNLQPDMAVRIETAKPYLDKIRQMQLGEYLGLLDKAYANHSVFLKDSAQKGTDLHKILERYVKAEMKRKKEHLHV